MTGATHAEREAGPVSAGEIRHAYQQIRPYLRRTPTLTVPLAALTRASSEDAGPGVVLKLEQLQCAGSFKTRGAFAEPAAARDTDCRGGRGLRG
jgi:threonine dehydratase